jgi:hypothetical protein
MEQKGQVRPYERCWRQGRRWTTWTATDALRCLEQRAGADINHASNCGYAPLAIARANNQEAAVRALVQAGATE